MHTGIASAPEVKGSHQPAVSAAGAGPYCGALTLLAGDGQAFSANLLILKRYISRNTDAVLFRRAAAPGQRDFAAGAKSMRAARHLCRSVAAMPYYEKRMLRAVERFAALFPAPVSINLRG